MATKDERKKGTAAKDILEKRNVMIISVLKPNPNKFFGLLRQDSLVTTDEYDPDNTPVNKENQATKLFFLCSRRVEIKPSDFSKVLDILSTYSLLDEVVDEMKREGEEAGLMPQKLPTAPLGGSQSRQRGVERPAENLPGVGEEMTDTVDESHYEQVYPMQKKPHGQAVIINLLEEQYPEGSLKSVENFKETFKELHYTVQHYGVLSREELIRRLTLDIEDSDDSFVCCIMAHGENGKICAKDSKVDLNVLQKAVGEKCPKLLEKPKIFIIQACRGPDVDEPLDDVAETNVTKTEEEALSIWLSREADFYVAYSTTEGHIATVNKDSGCLYLNTLCSVFKEKADNLSLDEMAMEVHQRLKGVVSTVKNKPKKHIQMGQVTHTLRGPVRFKNFKK